MFVNDLTGLCRTNVFGGDFTTQIPVGFHPWSNVPFGLGYNVAGQGFNPAFNFLYNRIPQGFHQGFVPQGFVPQGFVPQTLGQVNPFLGTTPFGGAMSQHAGIIPTQIPYGFQNPYGLYNWNTQQAIQGLGLQNTICR